MPTQPAFENTLSLVTLDPLERRVILYLRLLRSAPAGRTEVEQDLVARTGPGSEQLLDHLEQVESLMSEALSRQLDIGGLEDVWATEDEMVFAELITAAADDRPADYGLQASRIASQGGEAPLARAAGLAAAFIDVGEVARCSCGKTSVDRE